MDVNTGSKIAPSSLFIHVCIYFKDEEERRKPLPESLCCSNAYCEIDLMGIVLSLIRNSESQMLL